MSCSLSCVCSLLALAVLPLPLPLLLALGSDRNAVLVVCSKYPTTSHMLESNNNRKTNKHAYFQMRIIESYLRLLGSGGEGLLCHAPSRSPMHITVRSPNAAGDTDSPFFQPSVSATAGPCSPTGPPIPPPRVPPISLIKPPDYKSRWGTPYKTSHCCRQCEAQNNVGLTRPAN